MNSTLNAVLSILSDTGLNLCPINLTTWDLSLDSDWDEKRFVKTVKLTLHSIFTEVLEEHKTTTNPQALEIMDFILQDLEKIDQFAHNFELMTHGETKLRDYY